MGVKIINIDQSRFVTIFVADYRYDKNPAKTFLGSLNTPELKPGAIQVIPKYFLFLLSAGVETHGC